MSARRPTVILAAAMLAATVLLPLSAWAGPPKAGARAAKPAAPDSTLSKDENRKETLVAYYVRMYGEALRHSDWITRGMAVISLSRIDDPRVTDLLLDVMDTPFRAQVRTRAKAGEKTKPPEALPEGTTAEQRLLLVAAKASTSGVPGGVANTPLWCVGNNVVQVIAWEALHARTRSLTKAQRERWISGTLALAGRGQFHGAMRTSLLKVVTGEGPTPASLSVFGKLFVRTNSLYPGDVEVLGEMRKTLTKWRSPTLVRNLIQVIGRTLHDSPRADHLLRGFKNDVPKPKDILKKGASHTQLWAGMRQAWSRWYNRQKLRSAKPGSLRAYRGTSEMIPPAEVLDPNNDKWRKDLELPRLHLEQLDVTFVVDSTGSMKPVVNWIQRDVRRMLWGFALLSREPRIGVTFYRDHGDAYVTKIHPMTGNGAALSRAIRTATAAGGGDVPEAVLDALSAAVLKQRWSRSDKALKVIVLVGDAPPHKKDMSKIEKLVKAAAGKGFVFYCIKARTEHGGKDLSSFDKIARWGKGKSFRVDFSDADRQRDIYEGAPGVQVATKGWSGSQTRPDRVILREVMAKILTKDYRDRVKPFTKVLLEYLETPVPERRVKDRPGEQIARRGAPPKNPKSLMGGGGGGKKKGGKKKGKGGKKNPIRMGGGKGGGGGGPQRR